MATVNYEVYGGDLSSTYDMPPQATILELKESIEERLGLKVARQELSYGGMVLHDHHTLEFYNIHDTIDLYVEPVLEKFTITVKSPTNESDIRVKETYTVADLKRKIERHCGYFATDMTLFRLSLEMDDDRLLSTYHVCEGCEIEVKITVDPR